MWDLIVSAPDHCLSFYTEIAHKETREFILLLSTRQRTSKALICVFSCSHMA